MQPEEVFDVDDRGDDTLQRFRYQITYAAIVSLSLLDDDNEVDEIFCEHHEDILIRNAHRQFIGVQVKTKDLGLGPFETEDETIKGCIRKFIRLENKFPRKFIKYVIVSNAGFYSSSKTCKNLKWLIDLAKKGDLPALLKNRSASKRLIQGLANECGCPPQEVVHVISKIDVKGDTASLNHINLDLCQRLSFLPQLSGQTPAVINGVSERLIQMHFNASSLKCEGNLTEDYISNDALSAARDRVRINGKRITRDMLLKTIEESLEEPVTLLSTNDSFLTEASKETATLVAKMDRGRISYENVELQKDNKYAAERHFVSWVHRYGHEKALMRYNQVQLIVQNVCQAVYDELFHEQQPFGTAMLREVRRRLEQRLQEERPSFFDCKHEHLLGLASMLTQECKVWWSKKFSLQ